MVCWLLHTVGGADLGVPTDLALGDRRALTEDRVATLRAEPTPATVTGLMRDLAWGEPVTGNRSPLAQAIAVVPVTERVELVLVTTEVTAPIAGALASALRVAGDAYGRRFDGVHLALSTSKPATGGLVEATVTRAVENCLAGRVTPGDTGLITWGSGATQVTIGIMDAATTAGLVWRLASVATGRQVAAVTAFDPTADLGGDPLLALLRRWRFHAEAETLLRPEHPAELVTQVRAAAESWRRAHLDPTTDDLRLLLGDALTRGDATSGFAVRQYVIAHYRELLAAEPTGSEDLVETARTALCERSTAAGRPADPPTLGRIVRWVRQRTTGTSASRQWLISGYVKDLNDIGSRSAHELRPPVASSMRRLRGHLTDVGVALPATLAWYIVLVGKQPQTSTRPELAVSILDAAAANKPAPAEDTVRAYLGAANTRDIEIRFLLLGTESGSASYARAIADRIGADADSLPDIPVSPDRAYTLLRSHFTSHRDETGAIVLIPTGPKEHLLPLMMASQRLAAEHGIPCYVRQNIGAEMHRLPIHVGAGTDLLRVTTHALAALELDTAARLFDAWGRGTPLATRTRELCTALTLRDLTPARWPHHMRTWNDQARTASLTAQRLAVWATLAERPEPIHTIRALFGAYAAIESGIRRATGPAGEQDWRAIRTDPDLHTLATVIAVRNELPASHGTALPTPTALHTRIATQLRRTNPTSVAHLLTMAAETAAARWPHPPDAEGGLLDLLTNLHADTDHLLNTTPAPTSSKNSAQLPHYPD